MSRWNRYEDDYGFPQYIPVGERKRQAQEKIRKLASKGEELSPVVIEGRNIAKTFWGKAWCDNIESYHDYENRLPRGRSYVRNGAVIDLQIAKGEITARVLGSEMYEIRITIKELPAAKWARIKAKCAGRIASLIDLIQGKLSPEIIELLCRKEDGLFPSPKEIKMICNCPDWADLCKHLAAVLYGIGSRLDRQPELFFLLRGVDQNELFDADFAAALPGDETTAELAGSDLNGIFGIELDSLDDDLAALPAPVQKNAGAKKTAVKARKKTVKTPPVSTKPTAGKSVKKKKKSS